mmetsp:Transcript_19895/g.69087  ORF Transcript_19895/g.69087 Transcript_19895/m.69087 type:complete len:203 (+) Transcript_19895:420-1028(+)
MLELRVGEAVAKREGHGFALQRQVADVEALGVVADIWEHRLARKDRVRLGNREGHQRLRGGVGVAEERAGEGSAGVLACNEDVQCGVGVVDPRHDDRAGGHGQCDHGNGLDATSQLHHEILIVDGKTDPVMALGGCGAAAEDGDIRAFSLGEGLACIGAEVRLELTAFLLTRRLETCIDRHRVPSDDATRAADVVVAAFVPN